MSEQEHGRYLIEQILRMLWSRQESGGLQETPGGEAGKEDGLTSAFAYFMDEMPGGFLIYHADRGEEIIYANRGLLRIFQCETMEEFREWTGNSFRGIVHPEELEEVEKSIWQQIASSRYDLDYVEYRIRRKDGSIRWIEDYGHFVHSDTMGDIFYVFLGDATEKRERILREKARLVNEKLEKEQKIQHLIQEYDKERSLISQEYLRQLEVIEGLSVNYESICYVDLDRDQIVPYRLSCRTGPLFGGCLRALPYTRYVEEYVDRWVHPEERETVASATAPDYIRKRLADVQTYYFNYRVLVDGELQYIQLRAVNVGAGEDVREVVLGYRRVDEEIQKQMEQQSLLAEALTKANLAITSKNTFLSNMSHDMRTPLHAIFGFTSLAKLNLGNPEEAKDYLGRVETASRQLLEMIDRVLEFSSQSGEGVLEETECDLRETLEKGGDFLRAKAKEKDIALTLDCGGIRHSAVYADQEKLRQLILYLANNALTYTNPGGRVSVVLTEQEELANNYAVYRLAVSDTGIGISPEFLNRIFEPFVREKNSTLSGVHGMGLGLAIAKNIVSMMGGTISVQSEVGRGSTFTATITLRLQPVAPKEEAAVSEKEAQRILLVEDNEINREIEMELLSKLGFDIDPAEDGRVALEKMKAAAPGDYDLILMDLQMPVMDGWQTSMAIRALPDPELARVPIIALSANVMEQDQQKSKESGIDAHLFKPMDLSLLLKTIEEITGKKRPS